MADAWTPKPLPPEPDIRLRTRIGWWAWTYLTWPWEIRKMKAAGFRRGGWMTWEYDGSGGTLDD